MWQADTKNMLQVVIPFTEKEIPLLLKNVELCFRLEGNRKTHNPTLLTCEEIIPKETIESVFNAVKKVFFRAELFTYHHGPSGWPSGPNHAFKMCAYQVAEMKLGNPWLWWEQDAVPLKGGWLKTLYEAYVAGGKPLAGHVVGGMEHMNGAGIYPSDLRQYSIRAFTSIKTPWDVAMKPETKPYTHSLNQLILHYWNIYEGKNYNGPLGAPLSVKDYDDLQQWITPEAVFLHRCKDGSVTNALLAYHTPICEEIERQTQLRYKENRKINARARYAQRRAARRAALSAEKGEPDVDGMAAEAGSDKRVP